MLGNKTGLFERPSFLQSFGRELTLPAEAETLVCRWLSRQQETSPSPPAAQGTLFVFLCLCV